MVIRNKILIGLSALLFMVPCSSVLANPTLEEVAKDVAEMKNTTTAIAMNNVATAYSKGTTVKHSVSFTPSMFFGFGACLSLYTAYKGFTNYLYAQQSKKAANKTSQNRSDAAKNQTMFGLAGLLASALGFYWTR